MPGIRIAIDRGGTFTDCVGNPGSGKLEDDVIIKLLSKFTKKDIPRGQALDTSEIESALITTKGFKDCLVIGNQSRPKIFDLAIHKPDVLYQTVLEIDERARIRDDLQKLYEEGYRSIAVCFMHSYTYPNHEILVGNIARNIGFTHISLSSELMPMIKLVPRATSATADAYLTPEIRRYIDGFSKGFSGGLGAERWSDGGLVDVSKFSGLRAILSGPAGGVVGYALTSYDPETKIPVIGFDMGGTSTDVSRYGSGRYEHVFETTTAGVTIQSPQLDINTVAAGGGSRLFWRNGLFVVGPESAGAHPGPACYRKGGPLTVTDANLFLGRLLPDFFPRIFGKNEDEGLDEEASKKLFEELTDQINKDLGKDMSAEEVAYGFIQIANETMTRPIRSLTEAKGYDTSQHRLATFGGAGGQHAVAIAESLGINQILVHKYSSVLSAYGMALADVVHEVQEPSSVVFSAEEKNRLVERLDKLKKKASAALRDQGFSQKDITFEEYLNMRYRGTESALMIVKPENDEFESEENAFGKAFVRQHEQEFGFTLPDRDILIDDIRVRGIGKSNIGMEKTVDQQLKEVKFTSADPSKMAFTKSVYFEGGRMETPVFRIENLTIGNKIKGPAILADGTQTIVVTPEATARILYTHVVIDIGKMEGEGPKKIETDKVDPILLSVFAHRFMAIAEQMGRALQKTSVSTNVKERLDYSCALFDAEGGLVANAPHLPVHLGSMSTCVRTQAAIWKGQLKRGDVLVSNHPEFGGTHLPDITVITPAFNGDRIIFYVASRAHHADIGGILPGSMPPNSRELFQEGAAIKTEKLVSEGHFNEERMTQLLLEEPAQYPGCSGTRCLADNINDLKAQVAANQKGINLISALIGDYGEDVSVLYGHSLVAEDFMDDGSPIRLKVEIDPDKGEAIFDFVGTGPEMYGNTNAPEAVTYSAIIYCLRSLISEDIPLNQGLVGGNVLTSQRITDVVLKAFQACAASQGDCNNLTFGYGGHVEGKGHVKGFGYYETIAGGSGAGPDWDGTSGVHTHMTNTRITDAEIFERRYPVILREFSIREGSRGLGEYEGGDGVVRDIEFRVSVQVSILSERRIYHPYGMAGGEDAKCGLNLWIRKVKDPKDNIEKFRTINLGGKNTAAMKPGERIIIHTPGGGGYGFTKERKEKRKRENDPTHGWKGGSVAARAATQETN
ncbi:Hydantoinase/oxoprolinase-domain-containing protein [Trichophaea hybrida]|nr:Hydantoinase/oxoprolinase-domain-containing protein [Trichophaea hybrida]